MLVETSRLGPPSLNGVDIGDARIEYLDYGGSGPGLLLLHATGFLPWLWHPLAQELSDHFRVIAPSLYNHRSSDPYSGGLGWQQLAGDVRRMCAELGLHRPFIAGHSMGATVAILANATQGLQTAGMVLIEPILLPCETYRSPMPLEQHPMASRAIRRRGHWPDRKAAWEDLISKPLFQSWDPEIFRLYIRFGTTANGDGGVMLACSPRQEAALFMGGMQHDPWPELPKVACPALVVEGEKSENRFWIDLRRVAAMIPLSRYAPVGGAGHLVPMEKPAETGALMRTFFESLRSVQ